MEYLASGCDSVIYTLDDHRVLRRNVHGADTTAEAELMRVLRARGFPVPEVFGATGGDIVMSRLYGSTLAEAMRRRPQVHRLTLTELHRRLHDLTAPSWLAHQWRGLTLGRRRATLHLDLHPLNVLVTDEGPVVIDWANAAAGDPEVDLAMTFVILAAIKDGDVPTGFAARGSTVARDFYQECGPISVTALDLAMRLREEDPNLTAAERPRLRESVDAAVAAVGE